MVNPLLGLAGQNLLRPSTPCGFGGNSETSKHNQVAAGSPTSALLQRFKDAELLSEECKDISRRTGKDESGNAAESLDALLSGARTIRTRTECGYSGSPVAATAPASVVQTPRDKLEFGRPAASPRAVSEAAAATVKVSSEVLASFKALSQRHAERLDPLPQEAQRPSMPEASVSESSTLPVDTVAAQIEVQAESQKPAEETARPAVRRRPGQSLSRRLTVVTNHKLIGDLIQKESAKSDHADTGPCRPKQHPAAAMQTPGMVLSVWGKEVEDEDRFAPYFSQKGINWDGEIQSMPHCIGLKSHRGCKPESPNQDDFFVLARPESVLIGVLDGHGSLGHEVSHFVQERLPALLTGHLRKDAEAWDEAVRSSVEELVAAAKKELKGMGDDSGCTVTVAMVDQVLDREPGASGSGSNSRWRLRCGYLGDSVAVHGSRRHKSESWEVTTLVDIHRPDRTDEMRRIKAAGGEVEVPECPGHPSRLVTPQWNLAMSRSFGDFSGVPYGLSSKPEMSEAIDLRRDLQHLVIVASDGIWDVIPPAQVVAFVGKFRPEEAQLAAERLVSKAQMRWQDMDEYVDDITVIIVWPSLEACAPDAADIKNNSSRVVT